MSDLPPGLEDFGARLTQIAERQKEEAEREREPKPPRRRWWRSLGPPVIAVMVTAAAGAGAVKVIDGGEEGEPITPEPQSRPAAPLRAEDPSVVTASAAPDPEGGAPWVVRAYTNSGGRPCVQVGRLRDGVFGQIQRREFRRLPAGTHGYCTASRALAPLTVVERRATNNRTLVFGLAVDPSTVTVTIGERVRHARPADRGAWVAVFTGAKPDSPVVVVRSKVGGREVVERLR